MKLEHWLLIILAFLIGALGQVPRPDNQPPRQNPQRTEQGNQNQRDPEAPNGNAAERNQGGQQRGNDARFYDFTLTDSIQAFFAVVLGIVALFQIYLMTQQNAFMASQREYMASGLELTRDTGEATMIAARASKQEADTAKKTLEFTQRAFLTIGKPVWIKATYTVLIPLVNYGRVACREFGCEVKFHVFNSATNEIFVDLIKTIPQSKRYIINPGEGGQHSLLVRLPAGYAGTKYDAAAIAGTIVYDTGFQTTDTFQFTLSYNKGTDGWHRLGGDMTEINFTGSPDLRDVKKTQKQGQHGG